MEIIIYLGQFVLKNKQNLLQSGGGGGGWGGGSGLPGSPPGSAPGCRHVQLCLLRGGVL